jgi:SAM-dependent methyltransferase
MSKNKTTAPPRLEEAPCGICGATDGKILIEGADLLHGLPGLFGVKRCGSCGFVYTTPRPAPSDMGVYYPPEYAPHQNKSADEGRKGALRRAVLREYYGYPGAASALAKAALLPFYLHFRASSKNLFFVPYEGRGRVLDVGCGAGRFLWRLRSSGWEVSGLDISEAAAASARENYGVEVAVGTFPHEHFPADSFDVVTFWNSLEHMYDPVDVLASAAKVMPEGGKVYIAVPNFASYGAERFRENWFPLDLPRHLNHFTPESIAEALRRAGFELSWVRGLRRSSALRRSAVYARKAGDKRLLTAIMKTRIGAGLAARIAAAAGRSSLMMVSAVRKGGG